MGLQSFLSALPSSIPLSFNSSCLASDDFPCIYELPLLIFFLELLLDLKRVQADIFLVYYLVFMSCPFLPVLLLSVVETLLETNFLSLHNDGNFGFQWIELKTYH
jgi:hypothetical protein